MGTGKTDVYETVSTPCVWLLSLDTVYLSALTFVLNAVSVPPSLSLCLSVSPFIFSSLFQFPSCPFSFLSHFVIPCRLFLVWISFSSLLCHQLLSLNKVIKLSTLFSSVCILTWQVSFLSVALKENICLSKEVRANLWEKAIRETRNPY